MSDLYRAATFVARVGLEPVPAPHVPLWIIRVLVPEPTDTALLIQDEEYLLQIIKAGRGSPLITTHYTQ